RGPVLLLPLTRLERGAEPQLEHPRLIAEAVAERRPPEQGAAFVRHVRSVVRMIEQIEDLENAVDSRAADERNPLLEPHVHAVNRIANQIVARQNRAVGAQARAPHGAAPFIAIIDARIRKPALAGAEEIDAAQLKSVAELPNAVDDGPLTLVSGSLSASTDVRAGRAVFAAEIGGEREADRPPRHHAVVADEPLVPRWVRIAQERQRVGRGGLPALAEALGKCEVCAVVIRPALQQLEVHKAPLRKGPVADVAEGIVGARGGVVR